MIPFRKVLPVFIAFTLISSLCCQEDTGNSQAPLFRSAAASDGSSGTAQGDTQQVAEQPVVDAPLLEQETGSTAAPLSINETPYVKNISTLVKFAPDAENAFFTDTGRLFVTDGSRICEITDRSTVNILFTDRQGIFGGIAQSGKWLYVIHATIKNSPPEIDFNSLFKSGTIVTVLKLLIDELMEKELLRADISAPGAPVFAPIHTIQNVLLPNGMAADDDGSLYVADQTFLPRGSIIRLTVTGDDRPVVTQETWLSYKDGCLSPNGIAIRGSTLYFTDFSITSTKPAKVRKVEIINGRPGTVETVYSAASFFDDLDIGVYRNQPYIAVADYLLNSIILINENDGTKTRLGSGKFANPSSVHFGKAPQFSSKELIITEKGILYETYSSYGNKLSCMTLSE